MKNIFDTLEVRVSEPEPASSGLFCRSRNWRKVRARISVRSEPELEPK